MTRRVGTVNGDVLPVVTVEDRPDFHARASEPFEPVQFGQISSSALDVGPEEAAQDCEHGIVSSIARCHTVDSTRAV